MSEAIQALSFQGYLAAEEQSQQRHEFVGGRMYLQAGGTERHDLAASLLFRTLGDGAIAKGCRPFIHNRRLSTPMGNTYYPDILVVCGAAADPLFETEATLIVEVLSPSSTDIDRREKAGAYAQVPGLDLYILAHPDTRRLEVTRPQQGRVGTWEVYGPGGVLFTPFGNVDVDQLYNAVDALATT